MEPDGPGLTGFDINNIFVILSSICSILVCVDMIHSLDAAGLLVVDYLSPYTSQQLYIAALNRNILDVCE